MDKKPIKLTEQDLHFLVENAVQAYLTENGMEEGFWGGMKNVASKGANAVGQGLKNVGSAIGNQARKVGNAVGNQIQNVKTAYQQGSAQQDLQNVNNALQPLVQKGILNQGAYKNILNYLNKAMRNQGGQNMQGLTQ